MQTLEEIIPFAREMLEQRPSRGMLKLYMLGSTLAVLGVVGGLLETVLLPFGEHEAVEDRPVEVLLEEKKQVLELQTPWVPSEVVEDSETAMIGAKAKQLVTVGQRSSAYRLHAS